MNEEGAKFKYEKQLPPEEKVFGTKAKCSSKKPWVIKSEWRDDTTFSIGTYKSVDGTHKKTYTLKELKEKKQAGELRSIEFFSAFWGPKPYGINRYKTKKAALMAWENFVKKGDVEEKANYFLTNERTGETIEL